MSQVLNRGLLAVMGILTALALWTLLPSAAPRVNDLGYFSECPFAPWSTLMLLLGVGLTWVLRQYFLTRPPLE